MDQFFCFWEASGQSNIANATKFLKDFALEDKISIISFSDSNNYKKLSNYLNKPTQYFNCLPNFKGLQLAGTDCRRIIKDYEQIDESNFGNLIGTLNFNGIDINLSPKLNAIVGGRGSGKSLLLDSSALALKPKLDEDNTMIKANRKEYINTFTIKAKNYDKNEFIVDTFNFDYFNQSYISEIFNNSDPNVAIKSYFKDEFEAIEDIDRDTIIKSLKQVYKENIKENKTEKLNNISSLTEKYIINKNSKIKINLAKKDLIKGKTIDFKEYEQLYKAIIDNKEIVPKEVKNSEEISEKVNELIRVIYQEIGKYNEEVLIKCGKNHLINNYVNYNNSISKVQKEKNDIEDLFQSHLSQKQSAYIRRVSIVNAILHINNGFQSFYNKTITKNGVYDTKFTFEKSLTLETPIDFFKRISKKYLNGKKIDLDNFEELINIFCYKLDDYIKETKTMDNYLNELTNLDNLDIKSGNTIYYSINDNEQEDIFDASPGTQTNILMEYIVSKDTKVPLLIDQPEDNIDNETIFTKLTDWFYTLKSKRQIIVVTHDANIVINSDAENVIIANKVKKDTYNYEYGALEQGDTLNKISIILDGGIDAVERRLKKYGQHKQDK